MIVTRCRFSSPQRAVDVLPEIEGSPDQRWATVGEPGRPPLFQPSTRSVREHP
jgi:hypothetical protein